MKKTVAMLLCLVLFWGYSYAAYGLRELVLKGISALLNATVQDEALNAFTAYIAGPALPNHAPRLRVAYVDEDGTATFIDGLPEDDGVQEETVAVYGPDGQRRNRMQRGVNIVRFADGTTRKVQY